MKKATIGLVVALLALTTADTLDAQHRRTRERSRDRYSHRHSGGGIPLSFEVRLDAGVPVQDSGDTFDTGVGFGVGVALDVAPTFALYGSYSRFSFEYDDEIIDDDFEEDGFELGGRVSLGTGGGASTPYALLGALFHEGDTGLEAGLGADYPVSYNLSITPLVRYRTIDDFDYLTLGVGARFRF
ncbi:MAG TPA: outer membrane beta-barrel protein [Longimicrobium sp.]|nr:outer membrane beta-barrel protein [Longimicrobium sp.]